MISNLRVLSEELMHKLWVTRCEKCFSTAQNHPKYPLQEKGQSGGNESSQRRPLSPRKTDGLFDLQKLPGHWDQWFCREVCGHIHSCTSKWQYSGIRCKVTRNSIIDDAHPIWWNFRKLAQSKNTRVWETQDRIGIVRPGDSSEEVRTWLSQIEDNGEKKKYRAEFANEEFWGQKRKLWKKRRGQESGDKTKWTKKSRRFSTNGKQTGSVRKETIAVSDTIWISVQSQHSRIFLRDLQRSRVWKMGREESWRQKHKWENGSTAVQGLPHRNLHQPIPWKMAPSRMFVLQVRKGRYQLWPNQVWPTPLLVLKVGWGVGSGGRSSGSGEGPEEEEPNPETWGPAGWARTAEPHRWGSLRWDPHVGEVDFGQFHFDHSTLVNCHANYHYEHIFVIIILLL